MTPEEIQYKKGEKTFWWIVIPFTIIVVVSYIGLFIYIATVYP